MATEYRLIVKQWDRKYTYQKRDLAHAIKGLEDALDAFIERQQAYVGANSEAWIEKREVTEWVAVEDGEIDG